MQKIIFVFIFLFDSMVFGKGPVARSIDEVTLTIDQKKTHEIVSKEMVRVFNSYSTWKELFKAYTEDLNSREKEEWKLFFENKNINLDKKIGIKFEYRKPFIIGSAVQNEEGVKTPQLKSQFKIQLINLKNNEYEINGHLIKISPRLNVSERLKLVWNVSESQIKKERSTAAAKPSSLFNLLIPEASALAFAGVPLWAWLTGSSGLVVGGGGLWWSRKMSEPARNLKQVIQEYQSRSGFEVVNVEFESNKLTSSGGSQTTFCEISRRGAFDVELNKASIILHEKRRVEDKLVVLPVTYVFSYELDEANRIKKDARGSLS